MAEPLVGDEPEDGNDDSDENRPVPKDPPLEDLVRAAYNADPNVPALKSVVEDELTKLPASLVNKGYRLYSSHLTIRGDRLLVKGYLFVPNSDPLRLRLLQLHHLPARFGHSGYKQLFELISRNYFWPDLRTDCHRFTINYADYIRAKASNEKK